MVSLVYHLRLLFPNLEDQEHQSTLPVSALPSLVRVRVSQPYYWSFHPSCSLLAHKQEQGQTQGHTQG